MKPEKFDAILSLVGGELSQLADGSIVYNSEQEPPSDSDIDAKLASMQAEYDAQEYARNRKEEYPELAEQLDLLFHDMTSGKGDKTGEWYKAVNKVKTDNPKG